MTTSSAGTYDLHGARSTLLYTLYGRALDDEAEHPILGDRWAGEVMYLPKDGARRLVATIAERFPSGELAFDVMMPWTAWFSALFGLHVWGTRDPREIEGWGRGVTLLEDAPSIAEYAEIPVRLYRANYRLLNAFATTRNTIRPLRYRFGD